MKYRTIFKWLLIVLFVCGTVTSFFGFFNGWPEDKVWKEDQSQVATLPGEIEALKLRGTEERTASELEAEKPRMDSLNNVVKGINEQIIALDIKIEETKNKKKIEELKAERSALKAQADSLTPEVSKYNDELTLNQHMTNLKTAEERIATGDTSVNTILYSTYAIMALALLALFTIIFVVNGINNPMGLVKLIGSIVIIVGIVWAAWAIAPGDMIHSETLDESKIAASDLKMTDTVLYLSYLTFGGAIVALVFSWIVKALRK